MSRMFFYVVKTSYCFVCKVIRTRQFSSFKGCILLGETKKREKLYNGKKCKLQLEIFEDTENPLFGMESAGECLK